MTKENHRHNIGYRPIWELDCLCRTVLLRAALTPEDQAGMLRGCICECLHEHLDNPIWVLMAMGSACRHANPVSTRVNRLLNERFGDAIARAADMTADAFVNKPLSDDVRDEFPGFLWAMLRSTDAGRQELGEYLVHNWLSHPAPALRRATGHECCGSSTCCGERHADATTTEALEQRIAEQEETIDRMLAYIQKTRPLAFSKADPQTAFAQP